MPPGLGTALYPASMGGVCKVQPGPSGALDPLGKAPKHSKHNVHCTKVIEDRR